jgi:hypothetical protein
MRAMIRIVVVLTVLLAGAVVADGVVRRQTEARIATATAAGIPGVEQPPAVSIGGFPFLTQLMAGRLSSVHLTAPTATVEGLRLDDVVVELTGVTTEAPYTAEGAVMTAMISPEAVQAVLSVELDLSVRDGSLVASTTVLGLPLDVVLAPRAAGQEVEVDVTGFVLAGASVRSADLPGSIADQLQGIRFAVAGLPAGMALTAVDVTPDGLRLSAEGRDLALTAA